MTEMSRREAAHLLACRMTDDLRAELRAEVESDLYDVASVAVHAMSRADFVRRATELYDEMNADLDPIRGQS